MSFFKEYWDIILFVIWVIGSVVLFAIFQNAPVLILNIISGFVIFYIVASRMGEKKVFANEGREE